VDWFASGCTDTVLFIGLVRWGIRAQAEEIIQSVARVIAGTGYVTFEFPLPLMSLILMVKKTSIVRFHKRGNVHAHNRIVRTERIDVTIRKMATTITSCANE
jgi:hypothetical protein